MAQTRVDPPPFKDKITDGEGNITPEFHDFLYRLWQRTGGDGDALDFITKLQTNRVYQQQLEPLQNGQNLSQLLSALNFRTPTDQSKIDYLLENSNSSLPVGSVIMWHGNEIPDGWAECNGENGTPDLRGRYVVASVDADNFRPGNTGGTLTKLKESLSSESNIAINTTSVEVQSGTGQSVLSEVTLTDNEHSHDVVLDNLPPYYAIIFIMKIEEPA